MAFSILQSCSENVNAFLSVVTSMTHISTQISDSFEKENATSGGAEG